MGLFFRFCSVLLLMAAIIAGTVDTIRSLSESALVTTPLGMAIGAVSVSGLEFVEALERPGAGFDPFLPAIRWSLQQPAFAVLLIGSLLLWMLGYRSKSRSRRRSLT